MHCLYQNTAEKVYLYAPCFVFIKTKFKILLGASFLPVVPENCGQKWKTIYSHRQISWRILLEWSIFIFQFFINQTVSRADTCKRHQENSKTRRNQGRKFRISQQRNTLTSESDPDEYELGLCLCFQCEKTTEPKFKTCKLAQGT